MLNHNLNQLLNQKILENKYNHSENLTKFFELNKTVLKIIALILNLNILIINFQLNLHVGSNVIRKLTLKF
jgi:hypothetical protein